MKIDTAHLLTVASANTDVVVTALGIFADAAKADATLVPDVLSAATGAKKPFDVVKAHPRLIASLVAAVVPRLVGHPELLTQLLGAISAHD